MGVSELKSLGGTGQAITTRPAERVEKVLPEHVQEPKVLARKLNEIATSTARRIDEAFSSPMLGGNILRDLVFTATQTRSLTHGLGRPWTGYLVVRAQTGVAGLRDVANPAGLTRAEVLTLRSDNAGTYDVWVF